MVSREEVEGAYRYLLNRQPEGEAAIERHRNGSTDLAALRARFLAAPEFFRANGREILRYVVAGEMPHAQPEVETECTPEQLALVFAHVQEVWSRLGEVEPHFSVVSHDVFKPEHIEGHLDAFLATGQVEVAALADELHGLNLPRGGYRQAVELGCGVGRVTRHLATMADTVTAFDISAPHLGLARDYLVREGVTNVALTRATSPDALVIPTCDLFYSRIVLQHNPPPVMLFLVRHALAALAPGGVAVFQLPTFVEGYRFRVAEYLADMARFDNQELHVLPQQAVFRAIADAGCDILSSYRDNSLPRVIQVSKRFVVRKR